MRNRIFVALIVVMLFCSACGDRSSSTPVNETGLPKYLFLEFWTEISRTASGERCENFVYIDGPGYSYEASVLRSSFPIDLTESKSILGCGKQINYPVGSGVFSNLYPIEAFPYTPDWADFCQTLTINSIDTSGTISAKVNATSISLEVGQKWINSITDNSDSSCQKVTTYRLINFGFINSDQITMPKE